MTVRGRWPGLGGAAAMVLRYVALVLVGFCYAVPFVWMVVTSLKDPGQAFRFPPDLIPRPPTLANYAAIWQGYAPFALFYRNSILVVLLNEVGTLLSCTAVAYSFARLRWPGRDLWFTVLLGTMMLPYPVTAVPLYVVFRSLGWLDTFKPLVVPAFFGNAFFIFLLRQFLLTLPKELEDAAHVDGCNSIRVLCQILLPLTKPALVTIALFTFVWTWNDFMGPLIYLQSLEKMTVSVGLAMFQGSHGTMWTIVTAGSTMAMLPVLFAFVVAQRYFVRGIVVTGLKA